MSFVRLQGATCTDTALYTHNRDLKATRTQTNSASASSPKSWQHLSWDSISKGSKHPQCSHQYWISNDNYITLAKHKESCLYPPPNICSQGSAAALAKAEPLLWWSAHQQPPLQTEAGWLKRKDGSISHTPFARLVHSHVTALCEYPAIQRTRANGSQTVRTAIGCGVPLGHSRLCATGKEFCQRWSLSYLLRTADWVTWRGSHGQDTPTLWFYIITLITTQRREESAGLPKEKTAEWTQLPHQLLLQLLASSRFHYI